MFLSRSGGNFFINGGRGGISASPFSGALRSGGHISFIVHSFRKKGKLHRERRQKALFVVYF